MERSVCRSNNQRWLPYSLAVVAISASLASTPPGRDPGLTDVGLLEDGRLTAGSSENIRWTSSDGGFTWEKADQERELPVQWGGKVAEIPDGTYEISDGKIFLTSGQSKHEVYDGSFFRYSTNRGIQEIATRNLEERHLSDGPVVLAHHPSTGNVVAAMGIQGVLVGTPDGRWHPVAVGPYRPTDFSLVGQMFYLVRDLEILLVILALGVTFTAIAFAVTRHRRISRRKTVSLVIVGLASWVFLPVLGTFAAYPLLYLPLPRVEWAAYPLVLVIAIMAFLLVQRHESKRDWADSCNDLSVILAAAGIVPAFFAPLLISTNLTGDLSYFEIIPSQVFSITALVFGLSALALSLPRVLDIPIMVLSVAGICILAYFGLLIGIPLVGVTLAKILVLALALIASLCVFVWRRRANSSMASSSGRENPLQ